MAQLLNVVISAFSSSGEVFKVISSFVFPSYGGRGAGRGRKKERKREKEKERERREGTASPFCIPINKMLQLIKASYVWKTHKRLKSW